MYNEQTIIDYIYTSTRYLTSKEYILYDSYYKKTTNEKSHISFSLCDKKIILFSTKVILR